MTNRQASAVQQSERTRYRRTRIVMRPCLPSWGVGAAAGTRRPAAKCDSSDAARHLQTTLAHNVISDTNWTNFEFMEKRPLGVAGGTVHVY